MTLEDVAQRVSDIHAARNDAEVAHSLEDALYADVLKAVADGSPEAQSLAKAALATLDVDFQRWCA